MGATVGIVAAEGISAALVENHRLAGPVCLHPADGGIAEDLIGIPAEEVTEILCRVVGEAARGETISAVGLAFPGVIADGGIVAESPNFQQMKGFRLGDAVRTHLESHGHPAVRVAISNDADAMAAGIAATHGQLDRLTRVWTLGNGIGYGRYPSGKEVWEGGHSVVSLDPKEKFCGCGGAGHLEGIMGYRAMRLRFLDLEPEEIFEQNEMRCVDFVKLWHRALAAATSSSIHMEGPGKFYITGPSAKFINIGLLHQYVADMVKMSTLQEYVFEVLPGGREVGIIGAVVTATSKVVPATA
jgi:predicted NBD/HSP70 family sugar kinase